MSLLSIVQAHSTIHSLNVPTGIIGNTDKTVTQCLGLLNELVEDIVDESQFQGVTYEATFNLKAQEDQGAMSTLAPSGYLWAHNKTFYDRTQRRPLEGPMTDEEWQAIKAIVNPGPGYRFRIRQNHLLISPIPTTILSLIAFEYASSWLVADNNGNPKAAFSADTDTSVIPEKILKKGLSFRWKRLKGLPYQADEADYYKLLNNYIATDGMKRTYDLAQGRAGSIRPGIVVPSGNWFH